MTVNTLLGNGMSRSYVPMMLAVISLLSCSSEPPPDRRAHPETAITAARYALHHHDLTAYYDTLTDRGVRKTLKNSIAICTFSSNPAVLAQMQATGHHPSIGCEAILKRHGWLEPRGSTPDDITKAWEKALAAIHNPRVMAAELEKNHREQGAGTSFVWGWLDGVELKNLSIHGNTATAIATFSSGDSPVAFERDETGWRFTPELEGTH